MIVRTAAAAAVLSFSMLGAGCVYEPQPAVPEAEPEAPTCPAQAVETVHTFSLTSSGGAVLMARVDGADIVGSDVSLARFDEGRGGAIRGHAVGRLVNLEAGEGRVTGLVSGGPMELSVERNGDTLVVEGLVRGRISAFRVDPAAVRGTIGRCSYELWRSGFEYEGRRSCGGPTERVSLRMPEALERWSDDERVAVIAILLDRG